MKILKHTVVNLYQIINYCNINWKKKRVLPKKKNGNNGTGMKNITVHKTAAPMFIIYFDATAEARTCLCVINL
jgi:hypothetical protein